MEECVVCGQPATKNHKCNPRIENVVHASRMRDDDSYLERTPTTLARLNDGFRMMGLSYVDNK